MRVEQFLLGLAALCILFLGHFGRVDETTLPANVQEGQLSAHHFLPVSNRKILARDDEDDDDDDGGDDDDDDDDDDGGRRARRSGTTFVAGPVATVNQNSGGVIVSIGEVPFEPIVVCTNCEENSSPEGEGKTLEDMDVDDINEIMFLEEGSPGPLGE